VEKTGSLLTLDGQPFYFIGANAYWLPSTVAFTDKPDALPRFMESAEVCGLGGQ
jgi:hypothetical protein